MTAFDTAWELIKMPARDRRYTLTEDDIKRISQLASEGMSQAAIMRLFNEEGIPVTRGIVHYWANEASRMKQRAKNALRRYEPGSEENARRIARDQEKRRENWAVDPEMKERHELQSTKDETRSTRHTFRGKPVEEAMKRLESGELRRPNAKVSEDDLHKAMSGRFPARYPGNCVVCQRSISPGEEVRYNRLLGGIACPFDCGRAYIV